MILGEGQSMILGEGQSMILGEGQSILGEGQSGYSADRHPLENWASSKGPLSRSYSALQMVSAVCSCDSVSFLHMDGSVSRFMQNSHYCMQMKLQ